MINFFNLQVDHILSFIRHCHRHFIYAYLLPDSVFSRKKLTSSNISQKQIKSPTNSELLLVDPV